MLFARVIGGLFTLLILAAVSYRIYNRRNTSFNRRLESLLDQAVSTNVVAPDQRTRLLDLARVQHHGLALSASSWIAVLAGLFVVAGISLIIAHNWDDIGPIIRILAFLAVLLLIGEACVRTRVHKAAFHVPLEFVWFFFPLLGIGLYAQTFQLSGDPIRPFVVWLVLTLPLAWLSSRIFLGLTHSLALAAVLFTGNFIHGLLSLTNGDSGVWAGSDPTAWLMTLAIWFVLIMNARHFLPGGQRGLLLGMGAIWIFALFLGSTPLHLGDPGLLFVAAMSLAVIWMLLSGFPGLFAWLGVLYGLTFLWHSNEFRHHSVSTSGMVLTYGLLAGAALLTALGRFAVNLDRKWELGVRAIVLVTLLLPLGTLGSEAAFLHSLAIAANVILGTIAVLFMWHGSTRGVVWQVNAGVALLLLLLITRFIDVLGDMFRSGMGLIVAGILLASVAFGVERGRRKLLGMKKEPLS